MLKRTALFRLTLIVLLGGANADWNKGLAAYERGDYATALREWQPLAEQGIAKAQHNLGMMYAQGQGVPQDDKAAVQWFRRAAEQGDANGHFTLAGIYYFGEGVPQDYVHAHMWADIAASGGDKNAVALLNLIEQEMTPSQITEAQKLARECVRRAYRDC